MWNALMPDTTVAAIIIKNNHKEAEVLLTKRNVEPFKGEWCLPGGHIDHNESAENAVIREIKEETGLNINPRFFKYFDEIIPNSNIHSVVLVFEGSGSGIINKQEHEVIDIRWFSISDALNLQLAFTHKEILKAYYEYKNRS